MSRSSHAAVNAGSAGIRSRLALAIGLAGCLVAPRRVGGERRCRDYLQDDRRARQHGDDAGPVLPRVALPGDRQRHRLPGQHQPGIASLPRPQGRQDHVLDPDAVAADQQPALLLQRLLRHAARRRVWRSCAACPAPIRRATTCAPRARSTCSAPYLGQTVQLRRLAARADGRHRRPHRADLGPRLRPGPRNRTTPGAPVANPASASTPPTSARASPRKR